MSAICHITSVHQWADVRILTEERRRLAEAGHDVTLVAVGDPGEERKLRELYSGLPA